MALDMSSFQVNCSWLQSGPTSTSNVWVGGLAVMRDGGDLSDFEGPKEYSSGLGLSFAV